MSWDVLVGHWHGFGAETKAAVIGAASTIAAATVGVGGLILQLGRQGKHTRDAIAEGERRKLKAQMYEDAVEVCDELTDAAIELNGKLYSVRSHIQFAFLCAEAGRIVREPSVQVTDVLSAYGKFGEAAVAFILLVERRQIIDPRIIVFRSAMNAALHDIREVYYKDFLPRIVDALPHEEVKKVQPWAPPSKSDWERLDQLIETITAKVQDVESYTSDFLREMQCLLLGDLFGTSLPYRQPVDPNAIVIRLDRAAELEEHIATKTAWGWHCTVTEAQTRKRFRGAD